jgi:Heterokaryon incompatibility protein (HET)
MDGQLSFRTRLSVWLASSILLFQSLAAKLAHCYYYTLLFYIFNLPVTLKAAESPRLTAVMLLYFSTQPIHNGYSRENIIKALNRATTCALWLAMIITFHQDESTAVLPRLNHLISDISTSKKYWILHFSCLLFFYFVDAPRMVILRTCGTFRRFDQSLSLIKNLVIKTLFFEGVAWLQLNKDHLLEVSGKCLVNFVEYFVYYLLIHGLCVLFWGLSFYDGLDLHHYALHIPWLLIRNSRRQNWRPLPSKRLTDGSAGLEEPFLYDALKGARNIRLLLLHPRHDSAPVKCSLFKTPLECAPQYEAVSYVWGNSSQRRIVHVNDGKIQVTANAFDLLKERSSFWFPRVVWIDSICINQRDEVERTQQVQLIGDIYRKAFIVTVWLAQSSCTMGFVDELTNTINAHLALDLLEELRLTEMIVFGGKVAIYRAFASQRRSQRWYALMELLRNPWFDRIWVVQEVALATSVRVVYGKGEMPWQSFIDGVTTFGRHPLLGALLEWTEDLKVRQTTPTSVSNGTQINEFRQKIQLGEALSFSTVLFDCYRFKATDQRDKIFGIRGICSNRAEDLTRPDYLKPLWEVYLNAARCILTENNAHSLLALAGVGYFFEPNLELEQLPSWVPDWTRAPRLMTLAGSSPEIDYKAGAATHPDIHLRDGTSLILRGRCIDTIEELGPIFEVAVDETGRWHIADLEKLNQAQNESYTLATESQRTRDPYVHIKSFQPLREAYWRTLIGDRTLTARPAPAAFAEGFDGWQENLRLMSSIRETNRIAPPDCMQNVQVVSAFRDAAARCLFGRRFCITNNGYIGLVPPYACERDIVCAVLGAKTPLVLRPTDDVAGTGQDRRNSKYRLVGECYIHGIMMGEAIAPQVEMEVLEIV